MCNYSFHCSGETLLNDTAHKPYCRVCPYLASLLTSLAYLLRLERVADSSIYVRMGLLDGSHHLRIQCRDSKWQTSPVLRLQSNTLKSTYCSLISIMPMQRFSQHPRDHIMPAAKISPLQRKVTFQTFLLPLECLSSPIRTSSSQITHATALRRFMIPPPAEAESLRTSHCPTRPVSLQNGTTTCPVYI